MHQQWGWVRDDIVTMIWPGRPVPATIFCDEA